MLATETLVGTVGASAVVTELESGDALPVPIMFMADILYMYVVDGEAVST